MSASSYAPELFGVPHLVDPSGALAIYWTDPPGAIVQFAEATRGTGEMAHWLATDALELMLNRFPGVDDLHLVIDMRRMTGRSAMARSILLNASGGQAAKRIGQLVLLPSVHMEPAYVMVIEGTVAALRLIGYRVAVEHDIEEAVRKHGLRIEMLSNVRAVLREP